MRILFYQFLIFLFVEIGTAACYDFSLTPPNDAGSGGQSGKSAARDLDAQSDSSIDGDSEETSVTEVDSSRSDDAAETNAWPAEASRDAGDASEAEGGSGECGSGALQCGNSCVAIDDAHCGTCDNDCTALPHESCATYTCKGITCSKNINSGYCLIDGVCYADSKDNSSNTCQYCDTVYNNQAWRKKVEGGTCDDGVYCNGTDTCDASGACSNHGTNPCTRTDPCKQCNETAKNCFSPNGTSCNDGVATTIDRCDGNGLCVGTEYCALNKCWKVPPTGQTACYDNSVVITCSGTAGSAACATTDFCGQDAQYSDNSRTFTCKSNAGTEKTCSDSPADGDVVEDSLTHLTWQRVLPSNYGAACANSSTCQWQQAVDYCASLTYAGQTGWRLPDVNELASLVNCGKSNVASDFPGMPTSGFWSSSAYAGNTTDAWCVYYDGGFVYHYGKASPLFVRCIRGESYFENSDVRLLTIGAGGEPMTLDRATGLIWQQNSDYIGTWKELHAYCEGLTYGGYTDWRLPNINEYISLVNYMKVNPASDLPGIISAGFGSSSSSVFDPTTGYTGYLWVIAFDQGTVSIGLKADNPGPVRCVRGGP